MPLRSKFILIFLVVISSYIVLNYAVQKTFIIPILQLTGFEQAAVYATLSILIGGLFVIIALTLLLQSIIIRPLSQLTQKFSSIKKSKDLSQRVTISRDDEIGALANEFDGLLSVLEDTQAGLKKQTEQQAVELSNTKTELQKEIQRGTEAEKKLKAYKANIEKTIDQKTAKLKATIENLKNTQACLIQTEKLASIGQLAAGVAHEINNPIGFIKSDINTLSGYTKDITTLIDSYENLITVIEGNGFSNNTNILTAIHTVQNVKKEIDYDYLEKDCTDIFNEILEGVERIAKIVADMKDYAYMETDKSEYIDIHTKIDSALNIIWNELKYKTKVIKEYGALDCIECYPQRIGQVFLNLLVNAYQAIEDKGTITISTVQKNSAVEIKIKDTGSGIPDDVLPKIFDPFFTTKDVGKGTGLGLNVAFNIIHNHHGKISASSRPNQGTTFTITLPLRQPQAV